MSYATLKEKVEKLIEYGSSFRELLDGNITEITIPDGINSIHAFALYARKGLVSIIFPESLTIVNTGAFYGCNNLLLDKLPLNLTHIGQNGFRECKKITINEIPESVKTIDSSAFNLCSSITKITFKGVPTYIGYDAFYNALNLTQINVPWSEGEIANAPWGATNATITYNYVPEEEI